MMKLQKIMVTPLPQWRIFMTIDGYASNSHIVYFIVKITILMQENSHNLLYKEENAKLMMHKRAQISLDK